MKADLEDLLREQWLRNRNSGDLKWATKDSRDIPVKDMSDEHLQNTINMLLRNEHLNEIACDYDAENFGDR